MVFAYLPSLPLLDPAIPLCSWFPTALGVPAIAGSLMVFASLPLLEPAIPLCSWFPTALGVPALTDTLLLLASLLFLSLPPGPLLLLASLLLLVPCYLAVAAFLLVGFPDF